MNINKVLKFWTFGWLSVSFFCLIMVFVTACTPEVTPVDSLIEKVVVIEGCEYFKINSSYGYNTYTHKGNCKNPIHVYNK